MAQTQIRGTQVEDGTIQRRDLNTTTVGQAVTAKIIQGTNVTLSSTGADSGTGDVTISAAAAAVSTDAGNQSKLGSDSLIYTPGGVNGFITKTAAYTLTLADRNKYIICSGGSWTLTLPAAQAGLCYNLRNDMGISGTTGTITIQPPSGTIDNASSLALLPQQECLVISDGTNWRTFGLKREVILGTQDIMSSTASGTVLLPVGYRYYELKLMGFVPVITGNALFAQFSSDGGSTWYTAASYYYLVVYNPSASTVAAAAGEASTQIQITPGSINAVSQSGITNLTIFPGSATQAPTYITDSGARDSSAAYDAKVQGYGFYNAAVRMNAMKFYCGSGNIANLFLTMKGVV